VLASGSSWAAVDCFAHRVRSCGCGNSARSVLVRGVLHRIVASVRPPFGHKCGFVVSGPAALHSGTQLFKIVHTASQGCVLSAAFNFHDAPLDGLLRGTTIAWARPSRIHLQFLFTS